MCNQPASIACSSNFFSCIYATSQLYFNDNFSILARDIDCIGDVEIFFHQKTDYSLQELHLIPSDKAQTDSLTIARYF